MRSLCFSWGLGLLNVDETLVTILLTGDNIGIGIYLQVRCFLCLQIVCSAMRIPLALRCLHLRNFIYVSRHTMVYEVLHFAQKDSVNMRKKRVCLGLGFLQNYQRPHTTTKCVESVPHGLSYSVVSFIRCCGSGCGISQHQDSLLQASYTLQQILVMRS